MKLFVLTGLCAFPAPCCAQTPLEQTVARLATRLASLELENAALKERIDGGGCGASALAGELKVFAADECPPGWREHNGTRGYLLTGRPGGGTVGTRINRPMDAGETVRSPEHTHTVSVNDPGHTHIVTVDDPGHDHVITDPGHGHDLAIVSVIATGRGGFSAWRFLRGMPLRVGC
jgi:hypothetical protein